MSINMVGLKPILEQSVHYLPFLLLTVNVLIGYCLTSSEQYFSYIHDESNYKVNNIKYPDREGGSVGQRHLTVTTRVDI